MKLQRVCKTVLVVLISVSIFGCASVPKKDYSLFRAEDPRSILVLPVINRTVDVDAPDYFLTTVSRPVAERGYYVFPINLTKRILEDDGLADANLVHSADPTRLGEIFGADAILYITIEHWEAKYLLISTSVYVEFTYILKSGRTGEEIWRESSSMSYSSSQSSSGFFLADLIINAASAAITKAAPNYIPLAQQANFQAVGIRRKGLPAGPYRGDYGLDLDEFPILESGGETRSNGPRSATPPDLVRDSSRVDPATPADITKKTTSSSVDIRTNIQDDPTEKYRRELEERMRIEKP